jgi:hypothetical protein
MVQQVFQGDEGRISEIEEPDGIILVRTTGVSGKLLRTRISRLKLSQDEQYDPSAAIQTIENSADMRLAMHQSNWRLAATLGGLESMPSSGRPHLAPIRDNITVDEALDNLLQTFGGIAVYAECVRPNGEQLFRISLYGE